MKEGKKMEERVGSSKPDRTIDINSHSGNSQVRSCEGTRARIDEPIRHHIRLTF